MKVKLGNNKNYFCEIWNGVWNESQQFFCNSCYEGKKPYHTEVPYWPPVFFCYIEAELRRIMNG